MNTASADSKYIQAIPKLELHAHLNGSLSKATLNALKANKEENENSVWSEKGMTFHNLNSCFDIFSIAHEFTKTPDAVKLATDLTIQEFARDGVIYLELRSTPRAEEGMTKRMYIQAIVDAIEENNCKSDSIIVTLLISINRSHPLAEAASTVELAIEFHTKYREIIAGIDFSGNPLQGKFQDFRSLLDLARQNGLKISLHCAEVESDETLEMVNFIPDRLGHFTKPNSNAISRVRELKIPLELCVTSNLKCGTVASAENHHFIQYYDNHPVILCTDDKGVFGTSLTCEYELVYKTFNINKEYFLKMNEKAVDFCFAPPSIKNILKKRFKQFLNDQIHYG